MGKKREARKMWAEDLHEQFASNEGAGHDVEDLAKYRYAVHVEREDDGWLIGCDTAEDIANVYLACMEEHEYEAEWVSNVYDLQTGSAITMRTIQALTVSVALPGDYGMTTVANQWAHPPVEVPQEVTA